MSVSFKKILLLATVMSALAAAGCSQKSQTGTGSAKIGVDTSALTADVAKITVSISGLGLTTPMTTDLTKGSNGIQWNGHVEGIPIGTDGVFSAQAFNSSSVAIYQGTVSPVTITRGGTTVVVIILQDMNGSPGVSNDTPIISGISMSSDRVIPGALVNLSVSASDPNGDNLSYLWDVTCSPAGPAPSPNGSFTATNIYNPIWTAPNTAADVVSICTFSIKVTDDHASTGPASVTTFFTIQVSVDFGKADIHAYPNTWPIISMLHANLVFHPDTSLQAWDFSLTATDPDNDDLNIVWHSSCEVNGGTWNMSAPNTITTPKFNVNDSVDSCNFTVTVTDLCTNGNCGAQYLGATGALADGQPRGGSVTGTINGHLPATAQSAPLVTVTSVPNTNGPGGATIVYAGGENDVLAVSAIDPADPTATLPLYFTWTPNAGSFVAGSEADSSRASSIHWLAPTPLSLGMSVTVKVTSQKSALSTTLTFNFVSSDACAGQSDGTSCDDLNPCTGSSSCQGGVCTGSNPVVCAAPAACKAAGVCQTSGPDAGTCTYADLPNNTTCTGTDLCFQNNTCQAGVCTGSNPVPCVALGQCYDVGVCVPATGLCTNPPKALGVACNDSNACTQTDACDGAGLCVGSNPVNCSSSFCMTGGTCNPSNGHCEGGTPQNGGQPCDDGNICTTGDVCVAGTCTGTGCVLPQVCTSTGCALPPANIVKPQVARLVATPGINGLAMDLDGHSYITGAIFQPGKTFDSGVVTSFGGADVLVAKFDPATHLATWAQHYGAGTSEASGSSDQFGYGVAVTADNTVAVIGNFLGGLQAGASVNLVNTGTAPLDFLIGLDGANGNGKWGKSFNEGLSGAIVAVAANPAHNLIAICGYAGQADTDLVPTATFGGGTDIVIGMFNSNGTLVWSRQIGGAAVEECDSLVIDNNGDLYAAGKYNGGTGFVTDLGLGALPNPGNSFRRWLWVAKFNGTTGATIANASFYGCATSGQPCMNGVHTPNALALDSQNKLLVTGSFTNVLSFDPTAVTPHPMTSAGGADAFVAKLDPATGFARVWSVSMGSLIDDSAQGVSVTSTGDVVAVGYYQGNTTGGATLTNAGAADAFVWKLSGLDGTTQQAAGYGDALGQSADKIAINGQGTSNIDLVEIAGLLNGTITFPAPAGALTATETSSFLVFATLAP